MQLSIPCAETFQRKLRVLDQHQRRHNQQWALHAMDAEKTTRVSKDRLDSVLCQLVRTSNQRRADVSYAREQRERVAAWSAVEFRRTVDALVNVHEELVRANNCKTVTRVAQEEQVRRRSIMLLAEVCQQLERTLNQRKAASLMDQEKQMRIQEAYMRRVNQEFERRNIIRAITQTVEEERLRRVKEMPSLVDILRASPSSVENIHTALRHKINGRAALQAMENEREVRMQRNRGREVIEQLERKLAGDLATQLSKAEQDSQVWRMRNAALMSKLERFHNQRVADQLSKTEQSRRAFLTYTEIKEKSAVRLGAIHSQLERNSNRRCALIAMDHERERRVAAAYMRQVLDHMTRAINQKQAAKSVSNEQQERIVSIAKQRAMNELTRRSVRLVLNQATENERMRRVNRVTPSSSQRLSPAVRLEIMRRGNVKAVAAIGAEREANQVLKQQWEQVTDQLERKHNQRLALNVMDAERTRRVAVAALAATMEQLVSRQVLKGVHVAIEQERASQMIEHNKSNERRDTETYTMLLENIRRQHARRLADKLTKQEQNARQTAVLMRATLEQLERYANRRLASELCEHERTRRIAVNAKNEAMSALERRQTGQDVLKATQAEQKRRMDNQAQIGRESLFSPCVYASVEVLLDDVHVQLTRGANSKAADYAMDVEQAQQCHYARFVNVVMCELLRSANARKADEASDQEQRAKLVLAHWQVVQEDVLRHGMSKTVTKLAEQERAMRVANAATDNVCIGTATENNGISLNIQELREQLHEQLVRSATVARVVKGAEEERQRRQHIDMLHATLEQMQRAALRKSVSVATEAERTERVARWRKGDVAGEVIRRVNKANVNKAMASEQLRRTTDPNEGLRVMRLSGQMRQLGLDCASKAVLKCVGGDSFNVNGEWEAVVDENQPMMMQQMPQHPSARHRRNSSGGVDWVMLA